METKTEMSLSQFMDQLGEDGHENDKEIEEEEEDTVSIHLSINSILNCIIAKIPGASQKANENATVVKDVSDMNESENFDFLWNVCEDEGWALDDFNIGKEIEEHIQLIESNKLEKPWDYDAFKLEKDDDLIPSVTEIKFINDDKAMAWVDDKADKFSQGFDESNDDEDEQEIVFRIPEKIGSFWNACKIDKPETKTLSEETKENELEKEYELEMQEEIEKEFEKKLDKEVKSFWFLSDDENPESSKPVKHTVCQEIIDINDVTEDNSLWYEEKDNPFEASNKKRKDTEDLSLGLDLSFTFSNSKDSDEMIGDFVKVDMYTRSTDTYNADSPGLSKIEKLFDTMETVKLQPEQSLNFEDTFANLGPNTSADQEAKAEEPILPDFDIDYDNIYDNIGKISEIEKHLEILYRPFTCLVDLNCRFSLYELAILLDDARYEPAIHAALFLRLRNPSAEIKIYGGGKITSVALTAETARLALLRVIRMVEELDYKTDIIYFSKNIVHASFSMPFKIDLEMFSEMHSEHVSGNPQVRPFITYKIEGTAIRFAVFPNGYVLVLHSKQHSETRAAISGFLPILAQFQNGYLTASEKYGSSIDSDISFKLHWECKLEEDKEGILLYS